MFIFVYLGPPQPHHLGVGLVAQLVVGPNQISAHTIYLIIVKLGMLVLIFFWLSVCTSEPARGVCFSAYLGFVILVRNCI